MSELVLDIYYNCVSTEAALEYVVLTTRVNLRKIKKIFLIIILGVTVNTELFLGLPISITCEYKSNLDSFLTKIQKKIPQHTLNHPDLRVDAL